MFCTNCGRELPDSNDGSVLKFCPHCGFKLAEAAAAAADVAAEAADVAAETVDAAAETLDAAVSDVAAEAAEAVDGAAETVDAAADVAAETAEAVDGAAETVDAAVADVAAEAAEAADAAAETVDAAAADVAAEAADVAAEAADQAEAADIAAGAAAADIAAAQAQPPKKKSKAWLIALIAVVVLAAAGYFVYQNLPSTKAGKMLAEAKTATEAGNYEAALATLGTAKELQPDNTDIKEAIADNHLRIADSLMKDPKDAEAVNKAIKEYKETLSAAGNISEERLKAYKDKVASTFDAKVSELEEAESYAEALDFTDMKADALGQSSEELDAAEFEVYKKWTENVLASRDADAIDAQLDMISKLKESETLKSQTENVATLENSLKEASYKLYLAKVAEALKICVDSNSRSLACSTVNLRLLSNLSRGPEIIDWAMEDPDNRMPIITDIEGTDEKMGIYNADGRYYVYLGQYSGTARSGNGAWFTFMGSTSTTYKYYFSKGTWANDKPNGTFSIYDYTKNKTANTESTVTVEVNVTDGLYNGEAAVQFDPKGPVYHPTYENGKGKVIDELSQDGKVYKILAYNDEKTMFMHNDNVENETLGILGFAPHN